MYIYMHNILSRTSGGYPDDYFTIKKNKKLIGNVSLIYVRELYCICQFEILCIINYNYFH